MRNRIVILTVVTAAVLCLSLALAQESRAAQFPEGWYPSSRCQNNADRDEAWAQNRIDEITDYDRRDLSGVWGHIGARDSMVPRPPFTEYGEELFEATRGEEFTSDGFRSMEMAARKRTSDSWPVIRWAGPGFITRTAASSS